MMDCDEILVAIKDRRPNQSHQVLAIVQKPVEPPDKGSKSSSSSINDSYSLDRLDAEKFRAEILSNSHSDIFRYLCKIAMTLVFAVSFAVTSFEKNYTYYLLRCVT